MSDPFNQQSSDPFMEGGSAPGIKFETPGEIHAIVVRKVEQKIDTKPDGEVKRWPNGDPMNVYVFTGECEGEERSLWVRSNMVTAIREATTKAGLQTVVNTKVTVKFTGLGEAKKAQNAPKLFAAKVEQVAPVAAGFGDEEPF